MITETRTGRRRSKTDLNDVFGDMEKRVKGLSDREFGWLLKAMEEMSIVMEGDDVESGFEMDSLMCLYKQCEGLHYDGPVVGVEEFCLDRNYLGHIGDSLYGKWRKDLVELFSHPYNEAIFTGSIGCGKTTACDIGLGYVFYELCMLTDPQRTYGLMPGSEIVLVCFNRDQSLARDVTFGGFKRKLEVSPFFNNLGVRFGPSMIHYQKKNIKVIAVSSRSANALGKDVFGGIIDETDFMEGNILKGGLPKPGEKPFAEMLHESIKRRMASRYDRGGVLPGKLFMGSSARHRQSFTNRRISEAANDPLVFCRDYAIYDVAPADRFMKEKFTVLVGNERINHKILTKSQFRKMGRYERRRLEEDGCRFIQVPMNFMGDFKRNLEDSIRDISGVVTVSMSPFFQVRSHLYNIEDSTLVSPIRMDEWCTDSYPDIDWSSLVCKYVRKTAPGKLEEVMLPRRHPEAPRHVHFDLSFGKTDPAGLAIGHEAGRIRVERRGEKDEIVTEEAVLVEIDLALRIVPPSGGEIDFAVIRSLVYSFQEHGYTISFASMDSFQSGDMRQRMGDAGIEAEQISVDKTTEQYTCLKTAIYEGRVACYPYPILIEELEQLQKDEAKVRVVHLPGGSKDVADAVCGVVYTLSTRSSYNGQVVRGISEFVDDNQNDDAWIRDTMVHSGKEPPVPAKDVCLYSADSIKSMVFSG